MSEHSNDKPEPNISTEHQKDGDAGRPNDTLDKDRADSRGQENVEDRPSVGTSNPEAYPKDQTDH